MEAMTCDLYFKPMSDKGFALHYTQRNVDQEEAMRCTHACVQKPYICNGSKRKEG